MPIGDTTTSALADSLNDMVSSARVVRRFVGAVQGSVDVQQLGENMGLDWKEVRIENISASSGTETQDEVAFQQIQDTPFSVTPSVSYAAVRITDRVRARLSTVALAQMGGVLQSAIQNKVDVDGITQLGNFSLGVGAAGTVFTHGHASALITEIRNGQTTEPYPPPLPISIIMHSRTWHALQSQVAAAIGTENIPDGITAEVFRSGIGLLGTIYGGRAVADDNITIDSGIDMVGAGLGRDAVVLVKGRWGGGSLTALRNEKRPEPADELILREEYAYGERRDVWGKTATFDAATPTS